MKQKREIQNRQQKKKKKNHTWKKKWGLFSFSKLQTCICLLFTILRPFGTKESIKRKVDHGG
jgi:hypothetical protein